jgi:DNA-binding MarR family transcriptional regulator
VKLTTRQTEVMNALLDSPKNNGTIQLRTNLSYYSVHGILRRLEDKNFVRRYPAGSITHWELTANGRSALGGMR